MFIVYNTMVGIYGILFDLLFQINFINQLCSFPTLGRSTADPIGKEEHKHKAGSVPKYLKNRQQQWKDEAQAVLDSAPDPDCPPGHVR